MGFGSFNKSLTDMAPTVGLAKMGLGGIAGGFNAASANKNAKIDAKNQNAANLYTHKGETATYNTERMPRLKRSARGRSLRDQMVAAIMGADKNGMAKLFPGFAQLSQGYTGGQGENVAPANPTNPFEVAGPPPEIKPQHQSIIGGVLKGIAGG